MKRVSKISVVTPSYNQARFIGETVESVLTQKGDFELEYIVMDGGSQDATVEVLKDYEKKVKQKRITVGCKRVRFEWVSRKDKGQSDAINKGLAKARGEMLAYINSDDKYRKGGLEAARKALEKRKIEAVYSDCVFIDGQGKERERRQSRPFDLEQLLDEKNYILQPTLFFTRSMYETVGEFSRDLYYCMDYDYWIRAARAGCKFGYEKGKYWAEFRVYADNKTANVDATWRETRKVARKYGGKFYSTMLYTRWRRKTRMALDGIGIDGERVLETISQGKRKLVG